MIDVKKLMTKILDKLITKSWTPTISRTSGGTVSNVVGRRCGNVVTLRFTVKYSTSVNPTSSSRDVFVGTLTNSDYCPPFATFAPTYFGNVPIICQLTAAGGITCRVTGTQAVTVSSGCTFALTYIVDD